MSRPRSIDEQGTRRVLLAYGAQTAALSKNITEPASGRDLPALALAESDATFGEVVGREFNPHSIARDDTNEVLSHFACHVCGHDVTAIDLHAKARVGEGLGDHAVDFESFFLWLLRH